MDDKYFVVVVIEMWHFIEITGGQNNSNNALKSRKNKSLFGAPWSIKTMIQCD